MNKKQKKALELLLCGEYSMKEIAAEVEISQKTLYNWRKSEEFQHEIDNCISDMERQIKMKLYNAAPKALQKQIDLLKAKSQMVEHLAAKDILDRAGYTGTEKIKLDADDSELKIVIDYGEENENKG